MIKVIVLTSSTRGSGAYFLEDIIKSKNIEITAVILNRGEKKNKFKHLKQKLLKIKRIGLLGAANGVIMRKWYTKGIEKYLDVKPIEMQCEKHNIPFYETPTINCKRTHELFKINNADLGLSLGNSYIGSNIFRQPTWGMINVHHEELPKYQNAQSIIWQIFNNSTHTGYTIHQIEKQIDAGNILYQEKIPIAFKPTLSETVSYNYAKLWEYSRIGLIKVLGDYEYYKKHSSPQEKGTSYTTPSIFQFFTIKANFLKLKNHLQ